MTHQRFDSDDRGAVMLIALFFAMFAVALLFYAIGIGHAVLFREKFQDAADAAALSSAVMHARAMNLIVLVNLVMAAILSVLVTIKLVEALCIIGMAVAFGLAWITFGATLAFIPPLQAIDSTMDSQFQALREPIFKALARLHDFAGMVRDNAPKIATALSVADIAANATLPDIKGAAVGSRDKLPVEDDTFPELCGRASELPLNLATSMLLFLPSRVRDKLNSPMHDLASSLSDWFCGDGGSSAPVRNYTEPSSYPHTNLAQACKDSQPETLVDDYSKATTPECDASQLDELDAEPDKTTGNCQAGHNCGLNGPYEQHVALAREQCEPNIQPTPEKYMYQEQIANVEYRWNRTLWIRTAVTYETPSYRTEGRQPCGSSSQPPLVSSDYNTLVRSSDNVNEVLPVCSNESLLIVANPFWDRTQPHYVQVTEVRHILGCQREENVHVDLSGGQPASKSGGDDKAPKRMEQNVKRWGEDFQIRAFLHADFGTGSADRIVKLSLWNRTAPSEPNAVLTELGNFSAAQAEYFYNGADGTTEWMWQMEWRALLRRFRMPEDASDTLLRGVRDALGSTGDTLLNQLGDIKNLIAH